MNAWRATVFRRGHWRRWGAVGAFVCAVLCVAAPLAADESGKAATQQQPRKTVLIRGARGWELTRDGKPYFIRGAGGTGSKTLLAKLGGNCIRTWGTENLKSTLDEAHRLGLSVAVGIWLGHERHGFNYNDVKQVADQQEMVCATIARFKDHPAVLLWGLGNEMEGFKAGNNAAIWSAVNNLAHRAKQIDPHHPTMTVVAEIGGERVQSIHRLCPDVDIVGINSYAGARTLPQRYREAGGTKPYILTEFGPSGPWESPKTAWKAVIESSSSDKAYDYRSTYRKAVTDARGMCLGSFAFYWGHKQEATATWFGMLLPDGSRLAAVDAMSTLWSGKPPENPCPSIRSLKLAGPSEVLPRALIQAELSTTDANSDSLKVQWVLQADPLSRTLGGDAEAAPPTYPGAIVKETPKRVELRMPEAAGPYRLFAYVRDSTGGAAVANVPLLVKGATDATKGAPAKLPLTILDEADRKSLPYLPSGWMGNIKALKTDNRWTKQPHSGKTCMRIDYTATDQWGAIAWQHPEGDFGDKPGGWNLTGAKRLTLWLRGEKGGETVGVEFGILGADKKFFDTAKGKKVNVRLTTKWQQVEIDLKGKNLTRIKTGLVISIAGSDKPITIYLDDCRYE